MAKPQKELHILGAFVHGCLTSLHALGLVYNLRKEKHWWQAACHAGALAFSANAVYHHIKEAQDEEVC